MKKCVGISLVLLSIYVNADSFKAFFRKLGNKKILSDSEYYKKFTIVNVLILVKKHLVARSLITIPRSICVN